MIANLGHFDPALLAYRPAAPLSESIIEKVGEHFNVPVQKLLGARRDQHVAFCRQVAMYLLRECTELSYPEIARALHRKEHTTVIHGYWVIQRRMELAPEFRVRIERLKEECQQ